jgi:hypothetical protein
MPLPFIDLHTPQPDVLSPLLRGLLLDLERLPHQDYFLSDGAKDAFQPWQHALVHRTQAETHLALKAALPKLEAYCARLALLLHLIWHHQHKEPPQLISQTTMQQAIQLTNWFGGQIRLVLAHNSPNNQCEGEFLKILNLLNKKGSLTAKEIRNYCWSLRATPVTEIRQLMVTLAHAGHATLAGNGIHLQLRAVPQKVEKVEESRGPHLPPQTQSQQGIQPLVEKVEAQRGVLANGRSDSSPPLQGGEILYSSTKTSETHSQSDFDPVEDILYSPLLSSTKSDPEDEPDINYLDLM